MLKEKHLEEDKTWAALDGEIASLKGKLDNDVDTLDRMKEGREMALTEVESLKQQLVDANAREEKLKEELEWAVAEVWLEAVKTYKNGLGKEDIEAAIAAFRKYAVEMHPQAVEQTLYVARHEHGYTGPGIEAYPEKLNHRGFLWEK